MKYNVTVDQAIARGRKLCVFVPAFFFFTPLLSGLTAFYFDRTAWYFIAAGVVIGILFSWLSWSFTVVRWKIWAYTNVRNVHELTKRAVESQIMWPEGNFFNRTEIKSQEQRYQLEQLKQRFIERDVFNDDANVPLETYVYISKRQMYFKVVLGITMVAFGIYLYTGAETPKEKLFTYVSPVAGVYFLYQAIKGLRNVKPVLVLSDEGIRQGSLLKTWGEISGERVVVRHKEEVLEYDHDEGSESFEIENLAISTSELRNVLKIYRGRFEEKNNPEL